jgi:hypothetical protein
MHVPKYSVALTYVVIQIPANPRLPEKYVFEMLFFHSLGLLLSATIASALRFPRHDGVSGATSSMITERELSAPSIVCETAGTDKQKPAAYSGHHVSSIQDCLAQCRGNSGCQSVAFDHSTSACLLYKAPVSGNINSDGSQPYQFYDFSCPQGGSSSITSVVTLTVTGAPIIAITTVVVIVTPAAAPTTSSSTSTSTSIFVVVVTVTQGVPLSSISAPMIETKTIYATLPPTTTSLPNPPASTPPSF